MNTILTITRLTFHEAWRRRMVIIALALGAVFILLYSIGFGLITREIRSEGTPAFVMPRAYNMLLLTGLYVVHFLAVMLAIFASVDIIVRRDRLAYDPDDHHQTGATLAGAVREMAGHARRCCWSIC